MALICFMSQHRWAKTMQMVLNFEAEWWPSYMLVKLMVEIAK
jgi:hypothetical protein